MHKKFGNWIQRVDVKNVDKDFRTAICLNRYEVSNESRSNLAMATAVLKITAPRLRSTATDQEGGAMPEEVVTSPHVLSVSHSMLAKEDTEELQDCEEACNKIINEEETWNLQAGTSNTSTTDGQVRLIPCDANADSKPIHLVHGHSHPDAEEDEDVESFFLDASLVLDSNQQLREKLDRKCMLKF